MIAPAGVHWPSERNCLNVNGGTETDSGLCRFLSRGDRLTTEEGLMPFWSLTALDFVCGGT